MSGRDSKFSVRLYDAEEVLRWAAALEGVSRAEFVRRAVLERAARIEEETIDTERTTEEGTE